MVAAAVIVAAITVFGATEARAELSVWNYDVLSNAQRFDADETLKPISIIGARNGTFSGAVAVESAEPIKGLKASVGRLASGSNVIDGKAIQVRFADNWNSSHRRYKPGGLDILLENAPAEVAASGGKALIGVWVTVSVPQDAAAGEYRGELKIEAEGSPAVTVPVELKVAPWVIPATEDWRTWMELIQSPDTLAIEYDVPLWSDRHWELIGRSLELIKQTGSRVIYIPLISQTNQGNEQSMVRWIRQADGTYKHDYSIMEKYLDLAEKHMGKPKMVVLYAWDIYLVRREKRPEVNENAPAYSQQQQRIAQKRWDLQNKGVTISVLDEKTGEVKTEYLPHFDDPSMRAPWQAVFAEVRKRLAARGLEEAMAMGMVNDQAPSREDLTFLHEVSGGLPWISHSHPPRLSGRPVVGNKLLHGLADISYEAHVYRIRYESDPAKSRSYGWKIPELRAFFGRHGIPNGGALRVRQLPEINITGQQRGVGRIGADYWYVVKNPRGERAGAVYSRYPENMWRNLNIDSYVLAPGADGPVATARLENLREGLQECEARIYIESVLLDEAKRARIGEPLAKRAQDLLDDRQRAIWRSLWTNEEHLKLLGTLGVHGNARNEHEAIWQALGKNGVKMPGFWDGKSRSMRSQMYRDGEQWFIKSGWQKRNEMLYNLAAEVQKALGE